MTKRYDLITNYRCGSSIEEMEPSDDGEWVRYEDPMIHCPACGVAVKQVASATLSLALWQHWNWVCTARPDYS